mgnify:CR=1 FL=1
MSKGKKAKSKTWLYFLGQTILWGYFHVVFRMKVVGVENVPKEGPVLLCSNHLAKRDPVLLGVSQKRQVFYMAKEELFRNPFLNGLFRLLGAFPVKRGTGGGDALEEAYAILEENGAALLAYKTKAPVVPVCITAGDGKQPGMFKRTLIRFGKPISAQELNIQNDSSMQLRRASRTIMSRIAQLREESCKDLGLPSQLEPLAPKAPPVAETGAAPAQEAPHEG